MTSRPTRSRRTRRSGSTPRVLTSDDAHVGDVAGAAGRADGERPGHELEHGRRHHRRQPRDVRRRRRALQERVVRSGRARARRTISVATPAGFTTPSNFQSITATVNAPTITMGNAMVGRDLQMSVSIILESAPPSPVTVTVTSNDGPDRHHYDATATVAGGTSVTFTNVTATTVGTIFVQGRALGGTTLTVQALGYTPDTSTVTVDPSGFILNMNDITTTAGAANTSLRIDAARLNPTIAQLGDVAGRSRRAERECDRHELEHCRRNDCRQSGRIRAWRFVQDGRVRSGGHRHDDDRCHDACRLLDAEQLPIDYGDGEPMKAGDDLTTAPAACGRRRRARSARRHP